MLIDIANVNTISETFRYFFRQKFCVILNKIFIINYFSAN